VGHAVYERLVSLRALRFVMLGIALAAAVLVVARWGRLRPVAALHGEVVARPVAQGRAVAWLERREDGDHLLFWSGRGTPRDLLSGHSLGALAFSGDLLLTSRADARGAAELLSVDTRTGKQESLTSLDAPARALAADGNWICSLSGSDEKLLSLPFVVAASGWDALWAVPRQGGRPTLLGKTWGEVQGRMGLLGVSSGYVYWITRSSQGTMGATTIFRRRLPDGAPEVLAREPGPQDAVLAGTQVAWTCYSREAATPSARRAVKAATLSGADAHLVADWLSFRARLLASGDHIYARDEDILWRLGQARGDQWVVATSLKQGDTPVVATEIEYLAQREEEPRLVAQGLSWPAKLRLALGL